MAEKFKVTRKKVTGGVKKAAKKAEKADDVLEEYIKMATKALPNAPWQSIVRTAVFTYLWWKAYGAGKAPKMSDLALGILYAETVPAGLQGGLLANVYALGALAALGAGFIPNQVFDEMSERGLGLIKYSNISGFLIDEVVQGFTEPEDPPELPQFVSECHAAGGRFYKQLVPPPFPMPWDPLPEIIYRYYCSMPDGKSPIRFETWLECHNKSGTYDFLARICNLPTSKI